MILEITNLQTGLIITAVTTFLAIIGWLFVAQITTNKSFKDALTEFRIAISVMAEQNKNRDLVCSQHRQSIAKESQRMEEDFRDLEETVNNHIAAEELPQRKLIRKK